MGRQVSPTPPNPGQVSEPVEVGLARRAAAGDRAAWNDLIDCYKRLVYSIPRRYRLPDDVCEDVFQNTFVLLVKELPRLRDPAALTKWLMTTAHRECWRAARKARGTSLPPELAGPDAAAPPEESMLRWERQHRIHLALEAVGGRCEAMLRAMFLDPARPSYSEIAERLGLALGSIGPVRARCLEKMVKLLEDLR
ncbi:MAG: sigma-70 family RNA polymerase sigma factor [Phycisphaerales bacterium]|nr:sigma-70 family RNA polymerase sigma factor [Phycisphaerales bacterium]